jgi:hypothetical protein
MRGAVHFRGGRRGVLVLVLREYGGWRLYGSWRGVRQGENQDVHSVVPVVSRRRVAASSVTPPASARIPPARGVREPPRAPGDKPTATQLARPPAGMRELETSPHVHVNNHTATHNML